MEILYIFLSTILVVYSYSNRIDYIDYGSSFQNLEVENYKKISSNSYLKFTIHTKEKEVLPFRFRLAVYPNQFSIYKLYDLPIDKDSFVETHYGNTNSELDAFPIEIKKNPINYFITNCEYTIPIPTGDFNLIVRDYDTGKAKVDYYIKRNKYFTIKSNETILFSVHDLGKDSGVREFVLSKIKIIPTLSDVNKFKKCDTGNGNLLK